MNDEGSVELEKFTCHPRTQIAQHETFYMLSHRSLDVRERDGRFYAYAYARARGKDGCVT